MIRDFFFVVKMLFVTAMVVMAGQIQVGQKTVEDHFHGWVKSSLFVDYIQEAVDGAVALVKVGYSKADSNAHVILAKISSRKHGKKTLESRSLHLFSLKRFNDSGDSGDAGNKGQNNGAPTSSVKAQSQTSDPE